MGLVALAAMLGVAPAGALPQPPLVVEGGARDGQVRLSPATQDVDGDRATWVLANGGDATLTFTLELHEVTTDGEGASLGASADLALGAEEVTLAPGELARIPLVLPADASPRALALVATAVDADPATTLSGVALVGGGGAVTPSVASADAGDGTFTVDLDADGPTLVDLAVRATAWPGFVHTETQVEDVFVPAGGRELEVALGGAVAGRVTIEVAVGGTTPARASQAVWWWPPAALVVLAVVLLLIAAAVVLLVTRRRRIRAR